MASSDLVHEEYVLYPEEGGLRSGCAGRGTIFKGHGQRRREDQWEREREVKPHGCVRASAKSRASAPIKRNAGRQTLAAGQRACHGSQ